MLFFCVWVILLAHSKIYTYYLYYFLNLIYRNRRIPTRMGLKGKINISVIMYRPHRFRIFFKSMIQRFMFLAKREGKFKGTRFTFLSKQKSNKIYETTVLKTLNIRQRRVVIPFTIWRSEIRLIIAPAYCLLLSQAIKGRQPRQNLVGSLSWEDEVENLGRPRKPKFVGQSIMEERAKQREEEKYLEICRFFCESSSGYWSVHMGEETTWGLRKNHQKGSEGIISMAHRRHHPKGETSQFMECWVEYSEVFCLSHSKINPKLNAALNPPNNAYKQAPNGSNCF